MVLRFQDNQGIQALDQNQIIEVFSGNSVSNGVNTTVNSGSLGQSDTLQVASGEVIVGGSKVSVSQQNVQIDSSDPDNPRKDVVFIDSNGSVQVDKGTPEDPEPDGANRFDLFQPAPPERDGVDGAVVAEVFVGAGASSVSSNDVRDRRLDSDLTVDQLQFFDSLDFGDDQNLNFGEAPDFSIRYDSTDDELKIVDEVNDTEKQAFDKSGDVFIRNGALQVGKDIQTTGATTIWDSSVAEVPDSALGTVDAGTLNLSDEFTNSSGILNVNESNVDHDSLQNFVANEHIDHSNVTVTGTGALTGGGDLTSSRTLDVATDGIGTDELDESAAFDFSSTISMDGGIDTSSGDLSVNPSGNVEVNSNNVNNVNVLNGDNGSSLDFDNSFNTSIFDAEGDERLRFDHDGVAQIRAFSSKNVSIQDVQGSFVGVEYQSSSSTPATFQLTNSNLDLSNNNIDDVASIDGGGDAVNADDPIALVNGGNGIVDQSAGNKISFGTGGGQGTVKIFGSGEADGIDAVTLQSDNGISSKKDRLIVRGGTSSANTEIKNGNLDLNGNELKTNPSPDTFTTNIDMEDSNGKGGKIKNGASITLNDDESIILESRTQFDSSGIVIFRNEGGAGGGVAAYSASNVSILESDDTVNASDTDGGIAIFVDANDDLIFKNRTGNTFNFSITMMNM